MSRYTCARCGGSFNGHKLRKRCPDCAEINTLEQCRINSRRNHSKRKAEDPNFKENRRLKAREERVNWYGITLEEIDELNEIQGGVCAGCRRKPKNRNLDIDHKHQRNDKKVSAAERRNFVRGLLCHRCNRALGLLADSPVTLRNLANYLEYPPAIKFLLPTAAAVLSRDRSQSNAG